MNRLFIKYLAPLLAISVIPLLVSGIALFYLFRSDFQRLEDELSETVRDKLTEEISYKNEAIAQTEGMYVEQEIDRIGNKMAALSISPEFMSLDVYRMSPYLENFLASEPAVLEVTILDKFGEKVYSKVSSYNLLNEDYIDVPEEEIFEALANKESFMSEVQMSSRTQLPYVTLGQPILQAGGNFEGAFILNLNLNFFDKLDVEELEKDQGMLYIISDKGRLISHPLTRELYQNPDYSKYDYIQTIMKTKQGTLLKGDNLVSYYTNKYNWITIIEIPTSVALSSVEENKQTILEFIANTLRSISITTGLIILLVLILIAISSIYITRTIIKPILDLTAATKNVSEGDYSLYIRKTSNDEIGELTDSFNKMTNEVRKKRDELVRSNEYIKEQAEELLDRYNSDLEQFAYVTTHDLIEPLRMITSYTQLLQRRYKDVYDDDAREYMKYIVEGVERMHSIINDLFEYSHIRTNINDFELVDFQEVFQQVVLKLRPEIEESQVNITCTDLPRSKAVFTNIVQLFQNLVANAIKFRKPGEQLEINISAEDKGVEWLFKVSDNGIGIDPVYKEKIFEIFKRLNKRDEYPGSGMGLAICKNIVERHGGKIWVESELGHGATFYFTIKKY